MVETFDTERIHINYQGSEESIGNYADFVKIDGNASKEECRNMKHQPQRYQAEQSGFRSARSA